MVAMDGRPGYHMPSFKYSHVEDSRKSTIFWGPATRRDNLKLALSEGIPTSPAAHPRQGCWIRRAEIKHSAVMHPSLTAIFWKGDTPPKIFILDVRKGTLFLSGRDTLDVYFHNSPGHQASCFTLCLNLLENLPSISRYEIFSPYVRDMTAIKLHPP